MEIARSPATSTADAIKNATIMSEPPTAPHRPPSPLHLTNIEAHTTSLSVGIKRMDTSLGTSMPTPDLPRLEKCCYRAQQSRIHPPAGAPSFCPSLTPSWAQPPPSDLPRRSPPKRAPTVTTLAANPALVAISDDVRVPMENPTNAPVRHHLLIPSLSEDNVPTMSLRPSTLGPLSVVQAWLEAAVQHKAATLQKGYSTRTCRQSTTTIPTIHDFHPTRNS